MKLMLPAEACVRLLVCGPTILLRGRINRENFDVMTHPSVLKSRLLQRGQEYLWALVFILSGTLLVTSSVVIELRYPERLQIHHRSRMTSYGNSHARAPPDKEALPFSPYPTPAPYPTTEPPPTPAPYPTAEPQMTSSGNGRPRAPPDEEVLPFSPYPTSAPYPTTEPRPSPAPYPTPVPYPTAEPRPTPPPYPTPSPYPTADPPPYSASYPSATPYPLAYPAPKAPSPFPAPSANVPPPQPNFPPEHTITCYHADSDSGRPCACCPHNPPPAITQYPTVWTENRPLTRPSLAGKIVCSIVVFLVLGLIASAFIFIVTTMFLHPPPMF